LRIAKFLMAGAAVLALAACGKKEANEAEEGATELKLTEVEQPAEEVAAELEAEPESDASAERTDERAVLEKLSSENQAKADAFLEENAKKEGVRVTDSGLQYMVLEEGQEDGASPISTDLVSVDYAGTLLDGTEFDSSYSRGAAATFKLNQVIPGWTEGLQLMSEGDKFRFFIPPDIAYGANPRPGGPIGPNEALIFDVELHKVASPERNLAASKKFLDENGVKEGVKVTDSGLQYEVISKGEEGGASPVATDKVKVNYKGTLLNGTEFDSSYKRGTPAEFTLNRVIPGWTEGLQLMHVGDKFRFFIPPELGYGANGFGPIQPNEALIFEVDLLEVEK